jgi:hypothetical protein
MKQILQLIFIQTIFFLLSAQLLAQKRVIVDTFKTQQIETFSDGSKITEKDLTTAILEVEDSLRVKGIEFESLADVLSQTDGLVYPLADFKRTSGKIIFKISRQAEKAEITIIVSDDLNATKGSNQSDCLQLDPKRKFGVDTNTLLDKEVVYIYNFSRDISKRAFYKLKKGFPSAKRINMSKETLLPKSQVYIMVAGLNQFLYNATIDESFTSFANEPSELFKKIVMGDGISFDFLSTDKRESFSETDELIKKLMEDAKDFEELYRNLQVQSIKAYDPCECFPDCSGQLNISGVLEKVSAIRRDVKNLKVYKSTLTKEMGVDNDFMAALKIMKEIEGMKDGDPDLEKKQKELAKIDCDISQVTDVDESISQTDAYLDNAKREIAKIDKLLDAKIEEELPSDNDLKNLAVFVMNVVSQNQSYWKGPIQMDGDIFNFTLEVQTIDSVIKQFGLAPYKSTLKFKIPVLWSPFVSFSSGSFISIGNDLRNKKYKWQEVSPNATSYRMVESGYTNIPVGFDALGHVELKVGRSVGLGFSIGAGATIEDNPRVTYLLGGSVFIGNLKQLAITTGIAGMHVESISASSKYLYDNNVQSSTARTIDYDKEFKTGMFISLSYILFTTKDKQE